jgi:hypothetical protein
MKPAASFLMGLRVIDILLLGLSDTAGLADRWGDHEPGGLNRPRTACSEFV